MYKSQKPRCISSMLKLHALNCGKMFVDESSLVSGIHSATFRNQNPRAQWVEIPVCVYLIESTAGYILYDTGCHEREATVPEGEDTPSPYVFESGQLLPDRLKNLGISPDEIKYVVISHLHCDHAGYVHLFKNAEIIVSDDEFTGAMRLLGLDGFGAGPYKVPDFEAFLKARLNWNLIHRSETEYEICPGVTAVNFGSGHAFGIMGLRVDLKNSGTFLICSDALYRSDNLFPEIKTPGLIYDSVGYVRTANFIKRYAKKHSAKIIFGHDSTQFKKLLSSGGVWE